MQILDSKKPSGVMLSHDNITWTSRISTEHYDWGNERVLSYLPLSHIAACLSDCYTTLYTGSEVHFADSEALKGTLVRKYLSIIITLLIADSEIKLSDIIFINRWKI